MAEVNEESRIIPNPKKSTVASNPFTMTTPENDIQNISIE